MKYQDYIREKIEEECEKFKVKPTTIMRFANVGRYLVMDKFQVVATIDFDFQDTGVHLSVNSQELLIGPRGNRIFWWHYHDVDDMNEEVVRFFKVWHLILKDAVGEQEAKAA